LDFREAPPSLVAIVARSVNDEAFSVGQGAFSICGALVSQSLGGGVQCCSVACLQRHGVVVAHKNGMLDMFDFHETAPGLVA